METIWLVLMVVDIDVYARGGVVGAVCHGPAGLPAAVLAGREVAGFTDEEEAAVGLTGVVPFSLQQRLTERGALVRTAPAFQAQVVRDGRLVTGQRRGRPRGPRRARPGRADGVVLRKDVGCNRQNGDDG
ncbi:hypothetical protein ACPPVO_01925 [Dactylosporangium sp. McL0621]|uniref:hypothetical protein n=1 Tax=Dactylosporangium sp. McL0621 TaxID=3415678 RepID=UPI003CF26466